MRREIDLRHRDTAEKATGRWGQTAGDADTNQGFSGATGALLTPWFWMAALQIWERTRFPGL